MADPTILDLGNLLGIRLGKNISLFTNIDKLKYFIGFRLLIHCDECHDFLGSRSGWNQTAREQFYEGKRNMLYEDITWYINKLGGPSSINSTGDESFYNRYNLRGLITWARGTTRGGRQQPDFITNDEIAKKVANFVIVNIFELKPLTLSKIMGCGFDFDIYKISALLTYFNTASGDRHWEAGLPLRLCVDMTVKGRNLVPFYNVIFNDYFKRKARKECADGSVASMLQHGFRPTEPVVDETAIKFIQTPAQQFDSAGKDTIEKLLEVNPVNIMQLAYIIGLPDNTRFTLNFFGIPIIIYSFTPQAGQNAGVNLSIYKYFSIEDVGERNSNISSVSKISTDMLAQTSSERLRMTAFKTMGDFLQVVASIQINRRSANFAFITGDVLCGQIASIFIKSTYCEIEMPSDPFAGISVYLSKPQIDVIQQIKPDIVAVMQQILTNTPLAEDILDEFINMTTFNGASLASFAEEFRRRAAFQQAAFQRFGKKSNKLNSMSNEELKRKLHSVGINVTKLSSKGKRLNLTRKEMEKKATMFKNLQLRAKKYNIKLMYKSKLHGYVYKSYTRLMNDINRKLGKNKFGS